MIATRNGFSYLLSLRSNCENPSAPKDHKMKLNTARSDLPYISELLPANPKFHSVLFYDCLFSK